MCFSAPVSYGTAAVLISTGLYALHHARSLRRPYWAIALVPIFFGIQQGFEGRVWQLLDAGAGSATPHALGFLFFSHFLWLWWIPLSSHLVEPVKRRRQIFLGITLLGFLAGGLAYFTLVLNAHWLSVGTQHASIIYEISTPYPSPIIPGIPASAIYALIILVPLLSSSHRHLQVFGGLIAVSAAATSVLSGYAFISVWCFFAAALSVYLVFIIRRRASATEQIAIAPQHS